MARDFFTAPTGTTWYVVLFRPSDGFWWNTSGAAFESFTGGNYALYAVTAAEYGTSGVFYYTVPSSLPAGLYAAATKLQAGGSPAQSDSAGPGGSFYWDGAALQSVLDAAAVRAAVGLAAANLDTQLGAVSAQAASINAKIGSPATTVSGDIAAVNAKTTNLPAQPAAVGSQMTLEDNAITDAKISVPAETAGRPTRLLAMLRRVWEWTANRKTRDRDTGNKVVYGADDVTVLETQVQSTSSVGGDIVDQESRGV